MKTQFLQKCINRTFSLFIRTYVARFLWLLLVLFVPFRPRIRFHGQFRLSYPQEEEEARQQQYTKAFSGSEPKKTAKKAGGSIYAIFGGTRLMNNTHKLNAAEAENFP